MEPIETPTRFTTCLECHYDEAGRVVWETVEYPVKPKAKAKPEKTEQPRLNRTQRRELAAYIAHKAALQWRHLRKMHRLTKLDLATHGNVPRILPCQRCGLHTLAGSATRCQCKVGKVA